MFAPLYNTFFSFMADSTHIIPVPNVLSAECRYVEQLYSTIIAAPPATRYKLDFHRVSFVLPYGVVALVNGVRLLYQRSQNGVELINIAPNVHSYLERVDFFADVFSPAFCKSDPEVIWARSGRSLTVLEMIPLHNEDVLDLATLRARNIFTTHMGKAVGALVVMVLSELCTNVLLHSGDTHGTFLIQRCSLPNAPNMACVRVAVSDSGCGIKATLSRKHSHLNSPARAIQAAFNGESSRESERSALGLRSVAQWATKYDGSIWIRSENAALLHTLQSPESVSRVCYVPGTQVAVEFRVPVDDEFDCG